MNARKSILVGLISVFAAWGGFALAGVSAQAAVIHDYLSQIAEVPAGSGVSQPGPLTLVNSMTIDSGHLWIAETGFATEGSKSRIDEFDASTGTFIAQLAHSEGSIFYGDTGSHGGIAVGHETGEAIVYVEEEAGGKAAVGLFHEGGARLGAWSGAATPSRSFGSGIASIAVDNSSDPFDEAKGDVYVAVPSQKVIDVFHPEANGEERYVGQIIGASSSERFTYPKGLEVDEGNGDLIVLDSGSKAVIDVLEPKALGEYTLVRKITGIAPGKLFEDNYTSTIDGNNGEIYVSEAESAGNGYVIDEFSAGGEYLGRTTGLNTPQGKLSDVLSLAVDPSSHDLYVAAQGVGIDVFGPDLVIPDVVTGPVVGLKAKSATLTGTVNPDKAGAATCQFVWGTSTAFGHTSACSAPVSEGESPMPVEAQLSGLEPDTTYYYLLQASNTNGTNSGEPSQIQHFTTPGPKLNAESVSAVTAESVTFDAAIDPHKASTTYYFQYGLTSGYGSDLPAPPGGVVGSGEGLVEFSEHVQGLRPDTVYHYRVVLLSEVEAGKVEEFDGADQTFTTQRAGGAPSLPDGRSWELVTPANKEGALFFGQDYGNVDGNAPKPFVAEAATSGNAMVDLASQPTEAEPRGNTNEVSVLSTRGPAGWSSQTIAPPHSEGTGPSIGEGGEYRFFSEDLSLGVVTPFGNFDELSPEATEATPYLRTNYLNGNVTEHCQISCYRPLVTAADTREGVRFGGEKNGECEKLICGPSFVDATPDASHVVVVSGMQLTSIPNEGGTSSAFFYEWSGGQLQPLYLLPKAEGGTGVYAGELSLVSHQLSDAGAVFFSYHGHLYLHDFAKQESVRLDVPQGVREPSEGAAQFLYASSDGSSVLFTDSEQLTSAAGGGIYECHIVEVAGLVRCELELTGLSGGSLIGGSHDASYIYFLSSEGKLIVDHYEGRRWTMTEGPTIGPQIFSRVAIRRPGDYRVSPNGNYLAFMSSEDLTGYDTRDAISGKPDVEVYLYEAGANRLICASCNPTGARPVGKIYKEPALSGGDFSDAIGVASNLPPWTKATSDNMYLYQPRFLSNGGRLFFDSNDALVPQDVNGTVDTYEYEPTGSGDCATSSTTYSERSGGCVNLISSGTSAEESAFMDASETGDDVFFITLAKLVPQDYDMALDVYDAHACSVAVPCYPAAPVAPPACFTGDACKPAPTPQPSIFGPTSSATFSGAGNVAPAAPARSVKPRSSTRAQKLIQALKACNKKGRKQRGVCKKRVRKRYGPVKKSGKASSKRKGRG